MFRPRIIPILLIRNKGVIKTIKFKNETYIGDPMNAIKIFNDLEADELIVLDIEASLKNRVISSDLVNRITEEAFMPVAIGGGINSQEDARKILSLGAEKIIINSASVLKPTVVSDISQKFGNQSIVVSIDVKHNFLKKKKVAIHRGTRLTSIDPIDHAKKMEKLGAGEIMINAIANDGLMTGYDTTLISEISKAVNIPVIACGGAGSLEDLKLVCSEGNASAAAAGSIFVYYGSRKGVLINYPSKHLLNNIFNNYL